MLTDQTQAPLPQYTLLQILGIWVAATLPMSVLGWVVNPLLAPVIDPRIGIAGITRVILLTLGLIWQFVFSLLIVRQEMGMLTWATIRRRFWLNSPRDPQTGLPNQKLWLWLFPLFLLLIGIEFGIAPLLNERWVTFFPWLAEPPAYSLADPRSLPVD